LNDRLELAYVGFREERANCRPPEAMMIVVYSGDGGFCNAKETGEPFVLVPFLAAAGVELFVVVGIVDMQLVGTYSNDRT
jgi:hypothetical protein